MSSVVVGAASANQVVIETNDTTVSLSTPVTAIATIVAQGPQGPPGGGGIIVDEASKVDKSVVYYDLAAGSFKADEFWTITTLTDGGNF